MIQMAQRFVRTIAVLSFLVWTFFSLPAFAYEVGTHEEISDRATLQSDLKDYLSNVGLVSVDTPIETDYLGIRPRSARFWIRYGANHEDDLLSDGLSATRFLNHFYNPLTGNGLFYKP